MRTTFFTFLFSFFFCLHGHSQSCLPDGITFTTQAEIDSFPVNYPGCTIIEGDINISGINIENLNGLSNITWALRLYLTDLPQLTSLNGLGNLTTIEQFLQIKGCNALTDLHGLENVSTLNFLQIDSCNALVNLNGLENLSILEMLQIDSCNAMTSLSGLTNVHYIGGIYLSEMPQLVNLSGLENLDSTGYLVIRGCNALTDLDNLENIKTISGGFQVLNCNSLNSLSALANLTSIGSLYLLETPQITSLSGCENIATVVGEVGILGLPQLTSLSSLGQLTTVGGNFIISGCHALTNLNGLENTTTVRGSLQILDCIGLTSLDGLTNLDSVGSLFLSELAQLMNLNGLENLTHDAGDFSLHNIPQLVSLSSLEHLTTIGGSLIIGACGTLTNLFGLEKITVIPGNLQISGCTALITLNGLNSVNSIEGYIYIQYNPFLEDCSIHAICNQLLVEPDSVYLEGNDTACGSQQEVQLRCDLPPSEQCLDYGVSFVNQSEVDNFAIHYPGCKEILGPVFIEGSITSLDSLSILTRLGDQLSISGTLLTDLNGLENLVSIGGSLSIQNNDLLTSLTGLENSDFSAGTSLAIANNPMLTSLGDMGKFTSVVNCIIENNDALANLSGLETLDSIDELRIAHNNLLVNLTGLSNLKRARIFQIDGNEALTDLTGVEMINSIRGLHIENTTALIDLTALKNVEGATNCTIYNNLALASLAGLEHFDSLSILHISNNASLTNLVGLGNVVHVLSCAIVGNGALLGLNGLENFQSVRVLDIRNNPALINLEGLNNLRKADDEIFIQDNPNLNSLAGLSSLGSTGGLVISGNSALTNLNGLDSLKTIVDQLDSLVYPYDLMILNNTALENIDGLQNLTTVRYIQITDNPSLAECAVYPVCSHLFSMPDYVLIENNAPGCNNEAEVEALCGGTIVSVAVLMDQDGDCQSFGTPVPGEIVHFSAQNESLFRQTAADGITKFLFLGGIGPGTFSLQLPQVSADTWEICELRYLLQSTTGQDSISAFLLLKPLVQCPELTVNLGMPSFFRGCLTASDLEVTTQNTGATPAEGVKVALVVPPVLELLATAPPVDAQSGDTLYFDLGDLQPFGKANVLLSVRTKCDTFLFDQTLCIETFASLDNACPSTLPAFSEIKLSAKCIGDSVVRFTIKNIGDAPTQGWHEYKIIRNDVVQYNNAFYLNAQQSISYDFPAEGATWRMEATKFDDGTQTAVALEHCGGLTPGYITAFWLDEGPVEYDFDCRQVIGSFDPNLKSAVPNGWIPITANQPLQYTIDFQNTGTDTAFRVLLRDVLPMDLDLNTFRPGISSHPCTWEIRGNTLQVLFSPIALPDSNVNEPASHGFFSFDIDQMPNLPELTYFQNIASIIFDFNPPIYTNDVNHYIGQLTVQVDAPQAHTNLWQVLGNPTRDVAIFRAEAFVAGEKRFELYDVAGRGLRSAQFSGQEFEFQRNLLPGGLYFFRIIDAQGRMFTGKIIVAD